MRTLALFLTLALVTPAAEIIDASANARIRQEAIEKSQVMRHLSMLADRYGPRLTGSPNYEAAARWAAAELTSWGLKNANLEPWDFGHPGWVNERAAGYLTSPSKDNLVLEVLAWTPSTKGRARSNVVQIEPPSPASKEELNAYLAANAAKVKGKIVMVGKAVAVPVSFAPVNKRQTDEAAKARYSGQGQGGGPRGPADRPKPDPTKLTTAQATEIIDAWLVANKALVKVMDGGMAHGMIRAFQNRTYDVKKAVPTVILRNEDYGRAARLLARGEQVAMEFEIVNKLFPAGKTTFNVVAEIPGSDKADEVVMLGGHLDSWHAATGATDNGTGVAAMMEAVRVLQASGMKPRRTIRIALWSAEEQGLLGSKEYVKSHLGTFESPKGEFEKLVAYFNLDSGTGRIRGASVFGPAEAAAAMREILAPFADYGVVGAASTSSRREGGTDSTSFSAAGLTAVGLGQDPIEYFTHTWHTNLDTYERVVPDDMMKASAVIASAVWHVANRNEPLPRFQSDAMPKAAVQTE
jgi:hypothetical protein